MAETARKQSTVRTVLYVHPMDDYMGVGSPRSNVSRFRSLAAMPGLEVRAYDCREALSGSFWEQRWNRRTYTGKRVRAANAELLAQVKASRPDCVFVDSEIWLYPGTLQAIKRYAGAVLFYGTDDAMARPSQLWLHRLAAKHYDLYLTTCRFNVLEMRQRYGVRTLRAGMGYDHEYFADAPRDGAGQSEPSIVFVGHWEPHTEAFVVALRDAGLPVAVHGANWSHAKDAGMKQVQRLPGAAYIPTIANASMALCSLSHLNRNESTGRSFEIPAIGTMMLAEHTCEHAYLYPDGVDAALFRSEKELVEKARFYLENAEERQRIAANGHARCAALHLSWDDHLRREWRIATRILASGLETAEPGDDDPFWPGFRKGEPYAC